MDLLIGELSLRERIKEKSDLFGQTREKLGVTPAVGLAVLPRLHGGYTAGAISATSRKNGSISYTAPGFLYSADVAVLKPEEMDKVVMVPDYNLEHPYFVSVFQRAGHDGSTFEPRLLTCSDEILNGLYGHELAHWVDEFKELPPEISEGLDDVVAVSERDVNIQSSSEVRADLIAARYGLKREIIAKTDYMIECLSSYPRPKIDYGLFRTPLEVKVEMESRKGFVEKYS